MDRILSWFRNMLSKLAFCLCISFCAYGFFGPSVSSWLWPTYFSGITIDVYGDDLMTLQRSGRMRYKQRDFWLLYKPDQERVVSLVDKTKSGKYLLNPEHVTWDPSWKIDYGDIPKLDRLTKNKLDIIWGEPIESESAVSSYALSTRPPACYTWKLVIPEADFFIDARFKNGYLDAYRLRFVDRDEKVIHDWTSVKRN